MERVPAGPLIDLRRTPPLALVSCAVVAAGFAAIAMAAPVGLAYWPVDAFGVGLAALVISAAALAWTGFTGFLTCRRIANAELRLEGFMLEVSEAMEKVESRMDGDGRGRETRPLSVEVRVAGKGPAGGER